MSITTLLLFLIYTYFLGFTLTSFVKNSSNFLERNLMRMGLGLSLLPLLAIILNRVGISADWKIILAVSLIYPIYYVAKNYNKFNFSFKLTKYDISIFFMLILFFVNFYIYSSGAFSYPYLEDDDSWAHTFGVKYISMKENVYGEAAKLVRYMNPYPPAYDVLLGVLHQTNDSIYWTLKFFNALIISMSTIFFYFFVKELTGSKNKALFASFALMSIPAFMSHFIWGISLAIPLYFVALYSLERIKHDKNWWIVSAISMVTIFISTPTHGVYFGLFFVLYFLYQTFIQKKIPVYYALAGILGGALSFVFWWIPMALRYGVKGTLKGLGIAVDKGSGALSVGGTGDRVYMAKDFFFAQHQNMINNPIGIGVVISLLTILSLILIIYKYHETIKNDKLIVISSFFVSAAIMIFSLFKFYTKTLWSDDAPVKITFLEFFNDQIFLIAILLLALFSIILLIINSYKNENFKEKYLILVILLFSFTFYAVNASPFKYKISPFRTWMLLAIPVCILAAQSAIVLLNTAKKSTGKIGWIVVLILILSGVYFTSMQQKVSVNTANWPPGAFWTSGEEIGAYLWMKENLPTNSKVFTYWNSGPVIGMNMFTCHWCSNIRDYMDNNFNDTAQDTHSWLKNNEYEYIILDGQTAKWLGQEATNNKIKSLGESGLFKPVFQNQGAIILQVG